METIAERAKAFAPLAVRQREATKRTDEALALEELPDEDANPKDPSGRSLKHEADPGARGLRDPSPPVEPGVFADIAIVTGLHSPELEQVLAAFPGQWTKEGREGVVYNVLETRISGGSVRIAAAAQNDMGMVPAAILTTKAVRSWQPRVLAMVGICAGVKGKVNLGDIVVGKQVFDYGSGKLDAGRIAPDYQPVSLDERVCAYAMNLASDAGVTNAIREQWPTTGGKPDTELRVHVGPIASGAAVVADDTTVAGIQEHKRSLLAIDMEAFGLMKAATSAIRPPIAIVIKAVQDFADSEKHDAWREYSAFVSARFLAALLAAHWDDLASSP